MNRDLSYMVTSSGSETASWGHELTILVSASHLLVTINCSSNFAIYCAKVTEKRIYEKFMKKLSTAPSSNFAIYCAKVAQ